MPPFTLRLEPPAVITADDARESFFWLGDSRSSFTTPLGPSLGAFGSVNDRNIEFVRLAATVFAADRSVLRQAGGSNWNQRDIALTIPVSILKPWRAVRSRLEETIGFLTGDSWHLDFVKAAAPPEKVRLQTDSPKRVVLLSGGADSAIGVLKSRAELADDEQHILVSHFSANFLPNVQRRVAREAERLIPGPAQRHEVVHFNRVARRIDGTSYPGEPTSRSRSLLFLALGLAVASANNVPLWIPENGFASLNPPLGPERLGSLSTRTTHPAFLVDLEEILGAVGAHAVIENPFAMSTKGEMFSYAGTLIGKEEASKYLSATHSCSLTGQRNFGISPGVSCGVCFGCAVRRASFVSSGIKDQTEYIDASRNSALQRWLTEQSVEVPMRNLVGRGVRRRDVLAMNLPRGYAMAGAFDLCQRGLAELGEIFS
jgi:7-cyano-7-deazaguanine synthase in queuosine biosynthesis